MRIYVMLRIRTSANMWTRACSVCACVLHIIYNCMTVCLYVHVNVSVRLWTDLQ